ncbi:hypothetical protein BY996DRAFT_8553280 [Phakopsora pachyrhizi]|nr:hypothetical protein BY996DRAFT_8553280 [Phakopsora pachyrhizi]
MPSPQRNPSSYLTTEDYFVICLWLRKPSFFSVCFVQRGKTAIGRHPASKGNGYAPMAAEVYQKTKSCLKTSSKQMKEQFKTYKAKKLSGSTGFGVSENDQSKGMITLSQNKNYIETVTMVDEHIDDQHLELKIREKELQFAKHVKDKELEARMLMADKDWKAMKMKEVNALLYADQSPPKSSTTKFAQSPGQEPPRPNHLQSQIWRKWKTSTSIFEAYLPSQRGCEKVTKYDSDSSSTLLSSEHLKKK